MCDNHTRAEVAASREGGRVASNDVPVTIVGGGPVGLSMALALARQGVRSPVLEQKETTTDHPKARGLFPRAMEIFRIGWPEDDPVGVLGAAVDRILK
jgi:tetracenomycin A2 monooxygenase-dioxygenase